MVKKIQRYDVTSDMAMPRDDGQWVKYEDVASMLNGEGEAIQWTTTIDDSGHDGSVILVIRKPDDDKRIPSMKYEVPKELAYHIKARMDAPPSPAHASLVEAMREIEFRTRPDGDMADQAVNTLAIKALSLAGGQEGKR